VRLGGDEDTDGGDNVVVGNRLTSTGGYGVKLINEEQRLVCGNTLGDNQAGAVNGDEDPAYDPEASCR
jgi:hypothetical protein